MDAGSGLDGTPGDAHHPPRPRSELTELERTLVDVAWEHAVPLGEEDLDRGDNQWLVIGGHLRMLDRRLHHDAESACHEATALLEALTRDGCVPMPTSGLGAAAVTGEDQGGAGWRALLDVQVDRPDA